MPTTTHGRTAGALVAVGAVLGLLLALAAQADAATIYACAKKKGGSVRLVTRTTKCRRGENKLQWNSEGLAGPRGAAGSQGSAGLQGVQGVQGLQGNPGPEVKIVSLKTASSNTAVQTLFTEGGDSVGVSCGEAGDPSFGGFSITGDNVEAVGSASTDVKESGFTTFVDSAFGFYSPGTSFVNIASAGFGAATGYYAGMTVNYTFMESGPSAVDFHAELVFEVTDVSASSSECRFSALYYPVTTG